MEENFKTVKEMLEWLNDFAQTQDPDTHDKLIEISLKFHGMYWMHYKEVDLNKPPVKHIPERQNA